MSATLGYVVIEYNQASGMPDLDHLGMYDTAAVAEEEAERSRAETRSYGRRETYAVAEVVLLGDPT